MAELPRSPDLPGIPDAHAQPKSRWTFQVVWLIPIVSAIIGGYIAVKAILDRGPVITITFQNADGLEAGKTKLRYKDVEIGLVKNVALGKDLKSVVATAELIKDATSYLVDDSRFWVVRPRISGGTVSGLGTLLSGAYIGMDAGKSTRSRSDFQGLETPPLVTIDTPGREFVLRSKTMASVDSGSPVFFRRLRVGQVTSYAMDEDGEGVSLKVFVNEPYDRFVTSNTRFWEASGVDMTLDANGVKLEMQSIISLLVGGIAFETPQGSATLKVADANSSFALFPNRNEAMKNPDPERFPCVMVFHESVRGLVKGAPVDFRGTVIGEVSAVKIDVDPKSGQVVVPVEVSLYPSRFRSASRSQMGSKDEEDRHKFVGDLVARGLRAQLRSGSLITGQLYIALDFFPNATKAAVNWTSVPVEMPTTPGARQELQAALSALVGKIERLPLDEISQDARKTLVSMEQLLRNVNTDVTPELRQTLQSSTKLLQHLDTDVSVEASATLVEARKAMSGVEKLLAADAPLQHDTREAMQEIARAAYAFRVLADYLERNPQALLVGKKKDTP